MTADTEVSISWWSVSHAAHYQCFEHTKMYLYGHQPLYSRGRYLILPYLTLQTKTQLHRAVYFLSTTTSRKITVSIPLGLLGYSTIIWCSRESKQRDPVSETLCSLKYRTIDKVQKPSNPECYIPSLEPLKIYHCQSSLIRSHVCCVRKKIKEMVTYNEATFIPRHGISCKWCNYGMVYLRNTDLKLL
jgi:hypothetical protein